MSEGAAAYRVFGTGEDGCSRAEPQDLGISRWPASSVRKQHRRRSIWSKTQTANGPREGADNVSP